MVPRFLAWAFDWDVGASDKRGKYGKESSLGGSTSSLVASLVTLLNTPVRCPRDLACPLNSSYCKVLTISFVFLRARAVEIRPQTATTCIGWRLLRYGQNSLDHSYNTPGHQCNFLPRSASVVLSLTNVPLALTALCLRSL